MTDWDEAYKRCRPVVEEPPEDDFEAVIFDVVKWMVVAVIASCLLFAVRLP